MAIVVQKFGGSSVGDVERMGRVADRIAGEARAGKSLVVVVSAMGDTTDELLSLARRISDSPARRELDMLLSAGERISMALLSMALNARGVPAVSFTGSQSGILTTSDHTSARIVEVRPERVQGELSRGKVVIVAGYQGVSAEREVTTLGRGGSDTTAVALAAALGAEACEIYSDVDGVYTADPRVVPEARRLDDVSYEEMQELAEAGARVLNAQAVEWAKKQNIAIHARSTFGGPGETVVRKAPPGSARVVGVTSESDLVLLTAPAGSPLELVDALDALGVHGKQLLHDAQGTSLVLSLENLHDYPAVKASLLQRVAGLQLREGVGAVSAVGAGINAGFDGVRRTLAALSGFEVLALSTSSFRISVLLEARHLPEAVRRLHAELQPG